MTKLVFQHSPGTSGRLPGLLPSLTQPRRTEKAQLHLPAIKTAGCAAMAGTPD